MENIKEILAKYSDVLTEGQRGEIEAAVVKNYRTVTEVEKKTSRIAELEAQNAELSESVGALEANAESVEELRQKVKDMEDAESQRKAKADEDAKRDSFRTKFDAAITGKEFANDLIRDTVFESVYAECSKGDGVGISEAIEAVTKDKDGVWKNPQRDPKALPNPGGILKNKDESHLEERRTLAKWMFGKE